MKQELIKKMMAAKKMEYEAFKEIMPEGLKAHVDLMEEQIMDGMKDMAYSYFFGNTAPYAERTARSTSETSTREDTTAKRNDKEDAFGQQTSSKATTDTKSSSGQDRSGRTKRIRVE